MLKGVSKNVIEVFEVDNQYIERAILFLRPNTVGIDGKSVKQTANEYLAGVEYEPHRFINKLPVHFIKLGAAFVVGALFATVAIFLFI